jgi:Flp pilus assembly protein protease CpaA
MDIFGSVSLHILIALWLLACAAFDLRKGAVPNGLTLPVLFIGAGAAILGGVETTVIFVGVFRFLVTLYGFGLMGGADVKILAALAGLWPGCLIAITAGLALWVVIRRVRMRGEDFYAVPPMAGSVWVLLMSQFMIRFLSSG